MRKITKFKTPSKFNILISAGLVALIGSNSFLFYRVHNLTQENELNKTLVASTKAELSSITSELDPLKTNVSESGTQIEQRFQLIQKKFDENDAKLNQALAFGQSNAGQIQQIGSATNQHAKLIQIQGSQIQNLGLGIQAQVSSLQNNISSIASQQQRIIQVLNQQPAQTSVKQVSQKK